ncbi:MULTISPECIES: ABC transporter ATP-binding protein [Bacillus]|uniref:Bacitracin ABC transporter ATP-binding protein n=1 Tax=Bacillus thuringiensis serovar vazensis TaxID=180867 RepID=A0A243CXN5_BACTU|nr:MULTISPECIES: ABC transporter ATP-binding protein [Bacillus cereus group]AXY09229.1 ABC transporter ATP-binding protein [Bacillus thuringiensis LM1212]EEM88998.1 ABC transporter, ATP-binding protein [Bacillus thuringiensis serovar pulsiensis BGSC 4CC1]KXY69554.1 bacitracin ABC transporter ATP-binding protein [Bacillus cereus]MCU5687162.1 ABC transporter ATP-binding protein [Bacillus cereus]MEB9908120.1 ABC transporter ATP-binding protein [Bacillus anthracis]
MNALVSARNVTKIYNKNQLPGLNKVSFDIQAGEFVGIMGASGSGKTTLLNILSTIDTPTDGDVFINGVNIQTLTNNKSADFRKDYLGFIFQEYFLLNSLTVKENIAVPLTLLKKSPKEIELIIESLARRFGIFEQLSKYPSQLSGGQKQRVAAARALAKQPSILFADEPTGALDSNSATELLQKLKEVNEELQTTILMVTHDAYAASFSSRILIFKDGNIIKELKKNKQNRKEFFEEILKEISKIDENRYN